MPLRQIVRFLPSLPAAALALLTSGAAAAESAAADKGVAAANAVSAAPPLQLGASALQMALGLLFVLAMLFAFMWLLKILGQPRGSFSGLLRVVAAIAVGARERVVVVEVGDSWLVLGVAPGQVAALAEIPRQETPPPPPGANFPAWLRQAMQRREQG